METIQNSANIINFVVGKQRVNNNLKYRLLNFCLFVRKKGLNLLYNNLTKELLLLTDEEAEFISKPKIILSNSFLYTLAEKWFLVPVSHNDIVFDQQIKAIAKQFSKGNDITLYNIVTTTACNARCFYCFEAGTKISVMSDSTADAVARFIINRSAGKKVRINWFGGEPLCNVRAIDTITNILNENNVDFTSTMTTNGYLFEKTIVERGASVWNLRLLQITLDGMHDTYKKVKNYVNNDDNPLDRVVNNIGLLLKNDIAVTVRLNMDRHNSKELYELVNLLYELYGNQKKIAIYAQLLFENTGFIKSSRTDLERIAIADEFFKLRDHIDQLGLWGEGMRLLNDIKTNFCLADSWNGILISAEGKIGKCERSVDKDFVSDIYSNDIIKPWTEYCEPIDRCHECAYYPTCLRLKNCPNCDHECYEHEQKQRLLDLEKQIVTTYKKYLENNKDVV